MVRYSGIDFSADWKVVTFEGKTIVAPWKFLKDKNGKIISVVLDEDRVARPLTGFSNYRHAALAASFVGGVAARQ